jgi:hypothetical protein
VLGAVAVSVIPESDDNNAFEYYYDDDNFGLLADDENTYKTDDAGASVIRLLSGFTYVILFISSVAFCCWPGNCWCLTCCGRYNKQSIASFVIIGPKDGVQR